MPTVINDERQHTEPFAPLLDVLPPRLTDELCRLRGGDRVEEIRCRLLRNTYVTCGGRTIPLDHITTASEMEKMLDRVCGGSLYAHRQTLIRGYVTLDSGVRVGVCGRAVTDGDDIVGIYDVSSLNFRVPSLLLSVGAEVERLVRQGAGGVLIYSPAGEGKTTLLRSLIARLSSGADPLRVCVVDTRGELSSLLSGHCGSADMLIGYPKHRGIEIATRTMNAQLIVCDEIGGTDEARAILEMQNCGIPLLATAHGARLSDMLRREGIGALHAAGVFENYVGITRRRGGEFYYRISDREAADVCF